VIHLIPKLNFMLFLLELKDSREENQKTVARFRVSFWITY